MKHEQLSYNVDMVAWGHPEASAIGSQLLDGDHSHDWKIVATQSWAPIQQGREVGKYHIDKIIGKGEGRLLITEFTIKAMLEIESSTHWKMLFLHYSSQIPKTYGILRQRACYGRSLLTQKAFLICLTTPHLLTLLNCEGFVKTLFPCF